VKAIISHRVEVPSIQKATALKEKCVELLTKDEDVQVIASNVAQDSATYRVVGFDVAADDRFDETVEARSKDEASEMVATDDKKVVEVLAE
jgi:hypothetical protein